MRLLDLSFRFKIPLWGSLLIVVSALSLSLTFLLQARSDLKRDMLASSESLGRTLARTLEPILLHDDVWRGFEIVSAPFAGDAHEGAFRAEGLIILNNLHAIFVSSNPDNYPVLATLSSLGPAFNTLDRQLAGIRQGDTLTLETAGKILVAIPMASDEITHGYLILVHSADFFRDRFQTLIWRAVMITLLVLAILLPVNWYWGRRMARPLVLLSERMDDLGRSQAQPLPPGVYGYHDELGHLFAAYERMLDELAAKEVLEREIVKDDRLAALGRLAAGIAHEINNPLGGLITAVDTLKQHGTDDALSRRVLPLLERGLGQIRDIIGALLVEAKAKTRPLARQDVEDVRILLAQQARQGHVACTWRNAMEGEVAIPSTLGRQVLINLLLNAIQAATPDGQVECDIAVLAPEIGGMLRIEVANSGAGIPAELLEHLFEPFTGLKEGGHGLGLWITYQIVWQLGGHIQVDSRDARTRFIVNLPLGEMHAE